MAPAPMPQRFDSMLPTPAVPVAEGPRPAAVVAELVADTRERSGASTELGEIYTRSSGFRAMVTPAPVPTLQTFRGVEDQVVPSARRIDLQVPADAFVHSEATETVELTATLADGRPLPRWLRFDGKSGTFQGQPPAGEAIDLRLKVTARDTQGREATAMFRIKSGELTGGTARPGLSAQLMRPVPADRHARLRG